MAKLCVALLPPNGVAGFPVLHDEKASVAALDSKSDSVLTMSGLQAQGEPKARGRAGDGSQKVPSLLLPAGVDRGLLSRSPVEAFPSVTTGLAPALQPE